jgi:hypothetical protein
LVYQTNLTAMAGQQIALDLTSLPAGLYVVSVQQNGRTAYSKLVIQ